MSDTLVRDTSDTTTDPTSTTPPSSTTPTKLFPRKFVWSPSNHNVELQLFLQERERLIDTSVSLSDDEKFVLTTPTKGPKKGVDKGKRMILLISVLKSLIDKELFAKPPFNSDVFNLINQGLGDCLFESQDRWFWQDMRLAGKELGYTIENTSTPRSRGKDADGNRKKERRVMLSKIV